MVYSTADARREIEDEMRSHRIDVAEIQAMDTRSRSQTNQSFGSYRRRNVQQNSRRNQAANSSNTVNELRFIRSRWNHEYSSSDEDIAATSEVLPYIRRSQHNQPVATLRSRSHGRSISTQQQGEHGSVPSTDIGLEDINLIRLEETMLEQVGKPVTTLLIITLV